MTATGRLMKTWFKFEVAMLVNVRKASRAVLMETGASAKEQPVLLANLVSNCAETDLTTTVMV